MSAVQLQIQSHSDFEGRRHEEKDHLLVDEHARHGAAAGQRCQLVLDGVAIVPLVQLCGNMQERFLSHPMRYM